MSESVTKRCEIVTADESKVIEIEPILNFLFVVHNEIEFGEIMSTLKPINGFQVILEYIDNSSMQRFYIGKFFKYDVVLLRTSDMGSSNINAVINIINRAIQIFKPCYILMPGIAAGLDNKLKIGDVVIANKIIGYEHEKIAPTEIIGRYPEYRSPRLYNLFSSMDMKAYNEQIAEDINVYISTKENAIDISDVDCTTNCPRDKQEEFSYTKIFNGNYPKVYTGDFISGEKLLDNDLYRTYYKTKFKEAMALDMEGLGVAAAGIFNRVYDWAVVKGISDLGDGNKSKNKETCQHYAMKSVVSVLKVIFDNENSFTADNLKSQTAFGIKKVLISSSQCADGQYYNITRLFLKTLSEKLVTNNYKVLTGYGIGVGPAVMSGIFEGCNKLGIPLKEYSNHFSAFPFPRNDESAQQEDLSKIKSKNRELLCAKAQICIFAFGNKGKKSDNNDLTADGMNDELCLVSENKALIVPLASTGGTAKKIYERIKTSEGVEKYIKPFFVEKHKFTAIKNNIDDEVNNYMNLLKKLNSRSLENKDISHLCNYIDDVINLINLYS